MTEIYEDENQKLNSENQERISENHTTFGDSNQLHIGENLKKEEGERVMESTKNEDDCVKSALKKIALGYTYEETVDEFAMSDGELKLVKKKVSTKHVPPDVNAVKILGLNADGETLSVAEMTDEELATERARLLNALIKLG